jgi:hypothetical protein
MSFDIFAPTNAQVAEAGASVQEVADTLPDNILGFGNDEDVEQEVTPEVVAEEEEPEEESEVDETEEEPEGEEEGDESEEEPEGDQPENESEDDDPVFELQIGEDTYEVNLEELKHGYLRGEDYLAKVNEFEQQKLKWENEVTSERAALLTELDVIRADMAYKSADFSKIDWESLKKNDPNEYVVKRAQYAEHMEHVQKVNAQREALAKVEQKRNEIQYQQYLAKQQQLVQQLIPEWKDEAKRPELQKALVNYGKQQGLSDEELSTLADARLLSLLNKARKYDEGLLRKKEVDSKKKPKEVQPAIRPGVSSEESAPQGKRVKEAKKRFVESGGDLRNAVDYLDAIGFELPTLK